MTHRGARWLLVGLLVATSGCSTHLLFAESAHLGIKAEFSAQSTVPAEMSVGYRRTIVAAMPKRTVEAEEGPVTTRTAEELQCAETPTLIITDEPGELMSLYTTFSANVGWNDPVEVRHVLATGRAATYLLANDAALRGLRETTSDSTPPAEGDADSPK